MLVSSVHIHFVNIAFGNITINNIVGWELRSFLFEALIDGPFVRNTSLLCYPYFFIINKPKMATYYQKVEVGNSWITFCLCLLISLHCFVLLYLSNICSFAGLYILVYIVLYCLLFNKAHQKFPYYLSLGIGG